MKTAAPLYLKNVYFSEIESRINAVFFDLIYGRILKAIKPPRQIKNALNTWLADAIEGGRVWYENGMFYGGFNAKISKELRKMGAVYKKQKRGWAYDGALPPEISIARAAADSAFDSMRANILDALVLPPPNSMPKLAGDYEKTINKIDRDFNKTMAGIAVPPKLTESRIKIIAEEWGQNLDIYIKDWTDKNIIALRESVQANTFTGNRSAKLIAHIEQNYNVSKRKARFLARQETSLLMSKFRETRYKESGSQKYIWRGAMDAREREDHRELEGKIIYWDDPPVVDRRTGRRGHAGEDFGCRCVAVAIFD